MKNKIPALTLAFCLAAVLTLAGEQSALWTEGISLIPYPQQVTLGGEDFIFDAPVTIVVSGAASEADRFAAGELAAGLKSDYSIEAAVEAAGGGKVIELVRTKLPAKLGDQGYELAVEKDRITIRAAGEPGLFYGTVTLRQIVQPGRDGARVR
ncbi:MAG TPA: glycoside hydrolase family 20 zincin-like fold domain-containing protein, partial [Candidatus Glassbacteria bacterium]|nr:glycoside hydrolase family 20 zincin-like fold domain-containing protein [Candidatus Glassbacteria bacterium]